MPRSSSRPAAKPAPRPAARPAAPAPQQHAAPAQHQASPPPPAQYHAPPPPAHHAPAQPQSGGMLSGLGSTMAQGFAFGAGSSVARHAVDSVFNSFGGDKKDAPPASVPAAVAPTQPMQQQGPCAADQLAFTRCLQENPTNATNCDHYFQSLQACQNNRY